MNSMHFDLRDHISNKDVDALLAAAEKAVTASVASLGPQALAAIKKGCAKPPALPGATAAATASGDSGSNNSNKATSSGSSKGKGKGGRGKKKKGPKGPKGPKKPSSSTNNNNSTTTTTAEGGSVDSDAAYCMSWVPVQPKKGGKGSNNSGAGAVQQLVPGDDAASVEVAVALLAQLRYRRALLASVQQLVSDGVRRVMGCVSLC